MSQPTTARELFDLAVVLPPAERDALLDSLAVDPDVRDRVVALLRAHDRLTAGFLAVSYTHLTLPTKRIV